MADPAEQIAIVGMAGRFPGAEDIDALWELLDHGCEAIRPVPAQRWDAQAVLDPRRRVQDVGGFLEDVDRFDPVFFGISPREAADMDPQQRLLLETTWRALEDAGQPASGLHRARCGVYVGASWHDYDLLRKETATPLTQYSAVGAALDILASRISYFLKTTGPSMTVETGCSSALVALDTAVRALRHGDVESAIVGGANLILTPDVSIGLTHFGGLSDSGRSRAFSAQADGFVRGEGVVSLYLKRLGRALAEGDRVHAVVLGSEVNNDGGEESLVAPNPEGQRDLLRRAYTRSGVDPALLDYVETHGTGTPKGDPIEATVLGEVLAQSRGEQDSPLRIGSIKSNIGHLEAVAGLAGLVKVVLALRHRVIPPSLHAHDLNPDIDFSGLNLSVVSARQALHPDKRLHMAVNSFGWGGTNAHVILASPPTTKPHDPPEHLPSGFTPVSAHTEDALTRRCADLAPGVRQTGVTTLASTLAHRRDHFPCRAAFTAPTPDALSADLRDFADDSTSDNPRVVTGRAVSRGSILFAFPGQGAQWAGMGRDLYQGHPVFREQVDACARALAPYTDFDLVGALTSDSDAWLKEVDQIQPALWAVFVGLAELWRRAGVEPDAVVGHSQGEIAAATVAGVLSLDTAARTVARRAALLRSVAGRGLMLSVTLPADRAQEALTGFEAQVVVAVDNGPSCVLAGDTDSVLMLNEILGADGVPCRLVDVDYASHSPQMAPLMDPLLEELGTVRAEEGATPLFSTLRARRVRGTELGADYWYANLRGQVRFAETIRDLAQEGVTHIVEVSTHPVLGEALTKLSREWDEAPVVLSTLRRDAGTPEDMAQAFARAYVSGLGPFQHLPYGESARVPGYPWQRERHWLPTSRPRGTQNRGLEPRLLSVPAEPGMWQADTYLSAEDHPWLDDHKVHDTAVVPATAMLALALNAGRDRTGSTPRVLSGVRFTEHMPVENAAETPTRAALVWREDDAQRADLRLLSLSDGAQTWTEHARGRVHPLTAPGQSEPPPLAEDLASLDPVDFYTACAARGLNYGASFRVIRDLRADTDTAQATVELRERERQSLRPHQLHPVLWDGALQTVLALCEGTTTLVPTAVDRVDLRADLSDPPHQVISSVVRRDGLVFDVNISSTDERPLVVLRGLRLEALEPPTTTDPLAHAVHHMEFVEAPEAETERLHWWVVGSDTDGAAAVAEALDSQAAKVERARTPADVPPLGVEALVYVAPTAASGISSQRAGLLQLAKLASLGSDAATPLRLCVLTHNAQQTAPECLPDAGAALYWGFTRVLTREHSSLRCRIIDVTSTDPAPQRYRACAVELARPEGDDQVLLRGRRRLVGRILPGLPETTAKSPEWNTPERPFQLTTDRPGWWEGLGFRSAERRAPGPDTVEIEVDAVGLNFIDVMKAMGTYPDHRGAATLFGGECVGRVSAVGPDVTSPRVGDRVAACGFGSAASHVVVRAGHTVPVPQSLSDEDAVTLPLVAVTAWHGLVDLARLSEGETVLIHSAAGGLGLAAIQVAHLRGARVIATAGTEDKRRTLSDLGIDDVFDSRDSDWPDEVLWATQGRGVDVVLNSLTGAALDRNFEVLAEDGRFVEVGKKDIHQGRKIGLDVFRDRISFSVVDLAGLMGTRPERFAHLLCRVWKEVEAGRLRPLPSATFPLGQAGRALQEFAKGRHTGKFVLSAPDSVRSVTPVAMPEGAFRSEALYLLTGGLGALGLSLAEFMVAHGARHLALLGRSRPTASASRRIEALRSVGVRVRIPTVDVTSAHELTETLAHLRRGGLPLAGVVHAAGVLDDATVGTITETTLERVLEPKIDGARHLHDQTRQDPLDFFLMFSSAAALLGNTGQAAYAAANAYLDTLALARRAEGLPALSVQWGPFKDSGLAAADHNRGERLAQRGMPGFTTDQAWLALEHLLSQDAAVAGYVPLRLRQWFDSFPETAALSSWSTLLRASRDSGQQSGNGAAFLLRLRENPPELRRALVRDKVDELVGRVLRVATGRLDAKTPFKELGLDSLLGLELRNRLEATFDLRLPVTFLWTYGTPEELGAAVHALTESEPDASS
ncbi:type I polyketide synthase [Nocardiopsis salina]|uniref:type I polyketide synthase n=1 Tax=Nocardiopsis salina TaxID=245836 RepID=UPI000361B11E|nr:type I polyketide synthase [Nocardiopsis salina]